MRELCFTLAPAPAPCADGVEARALSDAADVSDARTAKRQRVVTDAAASTHKRIARVRMVERICELQDTADLDDTAHYGLFIWPSATVLAHFVARHWATIVRGNVVMEIGCGTGLPGILAAVSGDPKAVYLTDRPDAMDIERNVNANIELNRISHTTQFVALDWGRVSAVTESQLAIFATVDVLLAADCFYDSQDFENVFATIALIFRCRPQCKLYVTYQLRSVARTIAPLLARWGMTARALDTAAFLPSDLESDHDAHRGVHSVFLYEIALLGASVTPFR